MILDDIKNHIAIGADAKILQYEEHAVNITQDKIDLIEILGGKQNCILINMEKDVERYKSAVAQFEKVSIKKFVHLKGTDGRNKDKKYLEDDLTYILQFLSQFDSNIKPKQIKINDFSEINDTGVQIQDGPLGCYCSHLRALIYAYLNFEDYTIICEDDISITNTEKIEKYIKQIPDDWDIICLNSRAKNISYGDSPFYKFIDDFHSLHFYIVKNRSLPTIFRNMYPMFDQVDVLISDNMVPRLNIYNIPDTVYQKNIRTNTQNNLHIIFSSPNYNPVKEALLHIEKTLNYFANQVLLDNADRNQIIVKNLMFDVLYNFILNDKVSVGNNLETYEFDNTFKDSDEYKLMVKYIAFFIQCSKKGICVPISSENLANTLLFTLFKFNLHNTMDEMDKLKAYSFGSTAHTYKSGNNIIKKYNDKLRWSISGHDDPKQILQKEVDIIQKLQNIEGFPTIISYNDIQIKMSYNGESLYNEFKLPDNWKSQITQIFSNLTLNGIWYPEFRLQNILVKDDKITFVDFGLAEFRSDCDNVENLQKFIKYISLIEERFKTTNSLDEKHRLISTFSINERL
jgi:GR25 family glycosyltransferase involved in LPS biosynthesis